MTRLLPLLLTLSACDGQLSAYVPTVSFDRLDVNSVDWTQASTNFVFKVNNPNPIEISLAKFNYDLGFAGVDWASGDDPDGLTLGASDSSELSLPVDVVFSDLYDAVQATKDEDTIDFNLAGSFGFNTPIGLIDVPYDEDGGFPALRTPTFSLQALHVDDLSFTGATLGLDLGVENDHASTLTFNNFDYALQLDDQDLGDGSVADLGAVDGGQTGTLTLPINVDFGSAGLAIYDALTSSKVKVGLSAASDVDTPFGVIPLSIDQSGRVDISN